MVTIHLCSGCSDAMILIFFCTSGGAFFKVVVAQVCLGCAFSDTRTLFFKSLMLPIQIKLNLGFLHSSFEFLVAPSP